MWVFFFALNRYLERGAEGVRDFALNRSFHIYIYPSLILTKDILFYLRASIARGRWSSFMVFRGNYPHSFFFLLLSVSPPTLETSPQRLWVFRLCRDPSAY